MARILILTLPGDLHAILVSTALRRRGNDVITIFCQDFPTKLDLSIEFSDKDYSVSAFCNEFDCELKGFDTVWSRRLSGPYLPPGAVHPDDMEVATSESKRFYGGIWKLLSRESTWVNGLDSGAAINSKALQLRLAKTLGFLIPDTVMGNDVRAIRAFVADHGDGKVIYKPFKQQFWADEERRRGAYTVPIASADLPSDRALRASPGIYQQRIEKAFELRVTCFGKYYAAMRIDSQGMSGSSEDWRLGDLRQIQRGHIELSADVVSFCNRFMREAGLMFGTFDFAVTLNDQVFFLEVNEAGQFLFQEAYDPETPLLHAFVEFLEAPAIDFYPVYRGERIRFDQLLSDPEVRAQRKLEGELHLIDLPTWQRKLI